MYVLTLPYAWNMSFHMLGTGRSTYLKQVVPSVWNDMYTQQTAA